MDPYTAVRLFFSPPRSGKFDAPARRRIKGLGLIYLLPHGKMGDEGESRKKQGDFSGNGLHGV